MNRDKARRISKTGIIALALLVFASLINTTSAQNYSVYRSVAKGFSINVPSNWKQMENFTMDYVTYYDFIAMKPFTTPNQMFSENIMVYSEQLPQSYSYEEVFAMAKSMLTVFCSQCTFTGSVDGEGTINGLKANWTQYYYTSGQMFLTGKTWILYSNDVVYMIICSAESANYQGIEPIFDKIANSFKTDNAASYTETQSDAKDNPNFVKNDVKGNTVQDNNQKEPDVKQEAVIETDTDIPVAKEVNAYRFALIIGNEDYTKFQNDLKSEANVDFAERDAKTMKEYVVKTLGTPEKNVTMLINATAAQMKQGLAKINLLAKNSAGKADIIFYYAGHGLPDDNTKEPYMIPVDVSGGALDQAIKLNDAYAKLTEFPAQKITVFLDACFSGGARNQALQSGRAIKITPKENVQLQNKLVVFTASSGEQSALPYKEKQHGLFTYFLLKKLQETKGNLTYKDLSDYLKEKVALESVLVNNKEQNPQTIASPEAKDLWEAWKIK